MSTADDFSIDTSAQPKPARPKRTRGLAAALVVIGIATFSAGTAYFAIGPAREVAADNASETSAETTREAVTAAPAAVVDESRTEPNETQAAPAVADTAVSETRPLAAGRKPGGSARRRLSLINFAMRYHFFHDDHGHGPASLKELESYDPPFQEINGPMDASATFQEIRDGRLIVVWNAQLFAGDSARNESHVLAYEADVPAQGGLVITAGGGRHDVTAEQFQKMPKIPTAR